MKDTESDEKREGSTVRVVKTDSCLETREVGTSDRGMVKIIHLAGVSA